MRVHPDAETMPVEALISRGFNDRGDYLRRLASLSAILVKRVPALENGGGGPVLEVGEDGPLQRSAAGPLAAGRPGLGAAFWSNPDARFPLPNDMRGALLGAIARV